MYLAETAVAACAAFAATNLDDLLVMALFFAQAELEGRPKWPVVLGQFLGIGTLVAVSLVATLARHILPGPWTGMLGLLPIALAIREWRRLRQGKQPRPEAAMGSAVSWAGSVSAVTIVTVANGGDNLGIYIPLFASADATALYLMIAIFGVLTAAWCAGGFWLGNHPKVTYGLRRRGPKFVPWLFLALGLHILVSHRAWKAFL
jgi:cadmium resistance protein CadD (predicted permease)